MFDENSNCQTTTTSPAALNQANSMAMVNHLMNVKDSRWLQLEVCREFQRGQCSRTDSECKFAHPPPHVEVQNGRVTACYDSIKGRCTRENPKCKYLHPPQHLKDQLLINGRNNLALKNMIVSQLNNPLASSAAVVNPMAAQLSAVQQPTAALLPGIQYPYYATQGIPAMYPGFLPTAASPDAFQTMGLLQSAGCNTVQTPATLAAVTAAQQQKQRSDRVEALQQTQQIASGVPSKRAALDKSGLPVYQPLTGQTTLAPGLAINPYGQLTAIPGAAAGLHGYIPVTFAGHPPSMPRF